MTNESDKELSVVWPGRRIIQINKLPVRWPGPRTIHIKTNTGYVAWSTNDSDK